MTEQFRISDTLAQLKTLREGWSSFIQAHVVETDRKERLIDTEGLQRREELKTILFESGVSVKGVSTTEFEER